MKKPYIDGIFPIPIGHYELNSVDQNTLKILNEKEKRLYRNTGNLTSKDTHILRDPNLKSLEVGLLKLVNDFIKNVYNPANEELASYVTQSWLNVTKKGGRHHMHDHPNSFLSAVYYYDVGDKDSIVFANTTPRFLTINSNNYNKLNSWTWRYSVSNNDVIIFPSYLWHSVETKDDDKTRKSLAFNIFLKGKIGDINSLTELII